MGIGMVLSTLFTGVYGRGNGVLDGHPLTGNLMPVLDLLGPVAPSGLEYYEGSSLGADFTGNLFAALFNLHQITRHKLVPNDASLNSRTSVFWNPTIWTFIQPMSLKTRMVA